MGNIAWSGFNLLVLGGLLYLFYRAARLLWLHVGRGAAVIFGLALLLLGSRSTSAVLATSQHNMLAGIPADAPLGNASSLCQFAAGSGTTLALLAEYRNQAERVTPRGLFLTTVRRLPGHVYEPLAGHLTQQGQQLRYEVWVLHRWNLLGTTFYQMDERYAGPMPIRASL